MDITFEVMLPAAGGAFSDPGNNSFPMLSIVAVYDRLLGGATSDGNGNITMGPTPTMQRTGWVHVANVPIERFIQIERVLQSPWLDVDGTTPIASRAWGFVAASMPLAARNALRTNRQIAVTWTQLRNFLLNLKEQRSLTDAEIA